VAATVAVTGGGGAAARLQVTGVFGGIVCGSVIFELRCAKSVDTSRTSAVVTATTSAARAVHMSRPCLLGWPKSVSSSALDQARSGSSAAGGGTKIVSASAPCSDAAVSSLLIGVTLGRHGGPRKRSHGQRWGSMAAPRELPAFGFGTPVSRPRDGAQLADTGYHPARPYRVTPPRGEAAEIARRTAT
jgi:hypothetical protein